MCPPPGFRELARTIWSLIRPNRVSIWLYFFLVGGRGGGVNIWGGGGTCLTPSLGSIS